MERDEELGCRARTIRVEVDHDCNEHEWRDRERPSPGVELPSAGEIPGEDGQYEQTEVPEEPPWFLLRELSSEARHLRQDGRSQGEDDCFEPSAGLARRLVFATQDELLPQPAPVLACELPGQGVDVPHALHGDEERLLGCEAGRVQLGDLVAKMSL
jgi:hypothetical protein